MMPAIGLKGGSRPHGTKFEHFHFWTVERPREFQGRGHTDAMVESPVIWKPIGSIRGNSCKQSVCPSWLVQLNRNPEDNKNN